MPCCYEGDRLFKWCDYLKTVYTDAEGKDYCVFHAPQGNKGVSLAEFNELVFARIREAKEEKELPNLPEGTYKIIKEPCDLSGTIFEDYIDFSQFDKDNPLPDIALSHAQFSGDAFFGGTQFSGDADFWEARFSGYASFAKTQFNGNTSFMGAQFSGYAFFCEAQFSGDANFNSLHISEKARLLFQDLDKTKTFLKEACFMYCDIEGSFKFEGVDLSTVTFAGTQTNKIDFVNVRWHKSGWRGWQDTLYDEITLFKRMKEGSVQDEDRPKTLYTYYLDFKNWMKRMFFYAEEYGDQIRKVGILYRKMKDKYRNLQNWPEVSNWHYGEKEMYRKENAFRRYFPFSFSFLYWLSSGYGERYLKAGIVTAVLIFILSFGLAWTGLDAVPRYGSNPGDFHGITSITFETLDVKSTGALLINTIKYATFQKDVFFVPRNMTGEIIRCIAQILIPIQTALFILAVRNRFRK